ncbi:hypothetical protein J2Z31_005124 [Sinorhizobium kostiense]|uniref:Uncharacterized protein n=1 Tax=Sinorhizobium kostiense TaxID=76747 RepID=A0ABS4R6R8_9HYPH|nr:helicase [Sinorhizobium kostiense]MBP2238587.1 hypothetical protein [Sinorhizobium kostiense]
MRKHLVATFLIAVAIGPASALALGFGTKVGPVGVGAGVEISKNGSSAETGADADGVGGVKGGASRGKKGESKIEAGGNLGGKGGGGSGPKGKSSKGKGKAKGDEASGGRASGPRVAGRGGANTITPAASAKSLRASIDLPPGLRPWKKKRAAHDRGEWAYPIRLQLTIATVPGTPSTVVGACRKAIASAASPLGAVRVRAASAGSLLRHRNGALTAPLAVRIDYAGQDGIEVRQARIRCRLDSSGKVIAVI